MSSNTYASSTAQSTNKTVGNFAIIILILSLPFSTAIAQISTGLILILWFTSGEFKTLPSIIYNNPAYLIAQLLFICLLLGISYSPVPLTSSFSIFAKYRKLLLLVILAPFFADEQFRQKALFAFVIASLLTLFGSYAIYFELIPSAPKVHGSPTFKSSITHSVFISFFAFYCMHKAADRGGQFVLWFILLLLSAHNLFFLVPGRSGQLLFVVLFLLFSYQRFHYRGVLLSLLLAGIFLILFFSYSDQAKRYTEGIANIYSFFQDHEQNYQTPMGFRLSFWKYTLSLIAEKPWFGYGTGGYLLEHDRLALHNGFILENAHNEYLMITIQLGIAGLFLWLCFLGALYRHTWNLYTPTKWFAQGILLALIVNSLFNSTLLDHPEGHWFIYLIALFFIPKNAGSSVDSVSST